MITEHDLQEAIAECEGERNPNANTCLKLAAFYTIRNEMFGKSEPDIGPMYSFAREPELNDNKSTFSTDGETDFLRLIDGKDISSVLPVIDELMTTLQVLQPRLYDGVMRQLDA